MLFIIKIIFIFFLSSTLTFCSHSTEHFSVYSFFSQKECSNSYDENYAGHYKVGSPYQIKNITYYPRHDPAYDEVGMASWYGDHFHCKQTSNGQVFNKRELSAAHKTLPLPSMARVTNLVNNKSVVVIINDRGPFVGDRIIDLSEGAAERINMKKTGVAKVRVTYLEAETNMLLAKLNLDRNIKYASKHKTKTASKPVLLAENKVSKSVHKNSLEQVAVRTNPYMKKNELEEVEILVGKYSNKKEAIKTVKNLSGIGYAKLSQIPNQGKPLYEVQFASSIRSQSGAAVLLKKIIDLGNPNAHLIARK